MLHPLGRILENQIHDNIWNPWLKNQQKNHFASKITLDMISFKKVQRYNFTQLFQPEYDIKLLYLQPYGGSQKS